MPEIIAPGVDAEFQYSSHAHESDTAKAGMWLFLATEVLFFGGLVFTWCVYHHGHPGGFRSGAEDANLLIGSINTAVLVTSSFLYSWGLTQVEAGRNRPMMWACAGVAGLGLLFVGLKLLEWKLDLDEGKFPGQGFQASGADPGGEQLFWSIYWVGTALHLVHMLIGIGLVGLILLRARREEYTREKHTGVEVVGLYWSFVDMVWITLYPLIYVVGRS